MEKPLFVIEHLEPIVGRWLLIEYKHASKIAGENRLIFTNVKKKSHYLKLSKIARARQEDFTKIFSQEEIIILDPKAQTPLKPEDFNGKKAVVVGGILGDHPPRGRTSTLITSRVPKATARNIGKTQFSIDSAVYMAKLVNEGIPLEKIPVKKGLTIKVSENHLIHLPYAYPLKDGKPLISKELIKYLLKTQKFNHSTTCFCLHPWNNLLLHLQNTETRNPIPVITSLRDQTSLNKFPKPSARNFTTFPKLRLQLIP
ncbi:MAG: SAM-dependent methyltransferase [Candidatus Bathyarchaeia archaeon]